MNQNILSAASLPVGTPPRSPSEIGISITKTGTMEFDATKFGAALAADPAGTGRQGAGARRPDRRRCDGSASDKYTGHADHQDHRASSPRSGTSPTGSATGTAGSPPAKPPCRAPTPALEVALSNMKAQQSWLTAQLAGLSGGSAK